MYTQSQLVIMAMEAPRFRDLLELISEGYRKGMARKDRPYDVRQSSPALLLQSPLT